uniref:Uncharacterized protein n=1 Tax=Arundo donax TaxID=35708 RepID=A0A0A9H0J3_ARUDO
MLSKKKNKPEPGIYNIIEPQGISGSAMYIYLYSCQLSKSFSCMC